MPFVLTALLLMTSNVESQAGWYKDLTGKKTPEPIRKIAPRGVQLPSIRRAPEANSADTWGGESTTIYYITDDGVVHTQQVYNNGRKSSWRQSGARATLQHNASGQAYWVYRGATNSPLRASRHDRTQTPRLAQNYQSNYGAVSLNQNGNSVSGQIFYKSGRVGTFSGSVSGNQLTIHWRNGADYGRAWLQIDPRGNLSGTFQSDADGHRGSWQLYR